MARGHFPLKLIISMSTDACVHELRSREHGSELPFWCCRWSRSFFPPPLAMLAARATGLGPIVDCGRTVRSPFWAAVVYLCFCPMLLRFYATTMVDFAWGVSVGLLWPSVLACQCCPRCPTFTAWAPLPPTTTESTLPPESLPPSGTRSCAGRLHLSRQG